MTRDEAEKLQVGDHVYYALDQIRGIVGGIQYKRGNVTFDIVWVDDTISRALSEDMQDVIAVPDYPLPMQNTKR